MGSVFTRPGVHRHSYAAPVSPAWITAHAVSAGVPDNRGGQTSMPITSGVATFAADGSPYYNSGYLPGYPSASLPGGLVVLQLPTRAAQIDLSDRQSWDRPVFFASSR